MKKVTKRNTILLIIFLLCFWGGVLYLSTQYKSPETTQPDQVDEFQPKNNGPKDDISGFNPNRPYPNGSQLDDSNDISDKKILDLKTWALFFSPDTTFGRSKPADASGEKQKNTPEGNTNESDKNFDPEITKPKAGGYPFFQDLMEINTMLSSTQPGKDNLMPIAAKQKNPNKYNIAIIIGGSPKYQQEGYGNFLIQSQKDQFFNNRWIIQNGRYNYAEQFVYNTIFSNITISSNGIGNTALQDVIGAYGAKVRLKQSGSYNFAQQKVYTSNNFGSFINTVNNIDQVGRYNIYDSYQSGRGNHISTTQIGQFNQVNISQRGMGNQAHIRQSGKNNSVQITQN